MENQEEIRAGILSVIHDRSTAGRLVRAQEILTELNVRGLLKSADIEQEAHLVTMLKPVFQENQDLREIVGLNGVSSYYSVQGISETYAGILVGKSENPLWLIAQVVRENSKVYPRPVPMASFAESPFDLTQETISEFLEALGHECEYQDIEKTVTSAGTTFLYSSRHLEPDYAAMLAEWIDVGQSDNP
jgi:hypothetical protein